MKRYRIRGTQVVEYEVDIRAKTDANALKKFLGMKEDDMLPEPVFVEGTFKVEKIEVISEQ